MEKKSGGLTLDRDLANADWLRGTSARPPDDKRRLRMRYSGGIVKHLGLQMYSGAVPAIAELVANAWDADARNVDIEIPLGKPLAPASVISVRDDGVGMTFDEVNALYLLVGRNRRTKGEKSRGGRRVMGHKGIGKLAGFGIAHTIEIWTVDGAGWLTAFRLDYRDIVRDDQSSFVEAYSPPLIADRKAEAADPISSRGTLVRLRDLQLTNAISGEVFVDAMARRFAVLTHAFRVLVNGVPLQRKDLDVVLRVPKSGLRTESIKGLGTVRWWAGFTRRPIQDEHARGITVFVRGKMAQEPFFFRLSGGAHGQVGLEYLTGEVQADFLDTTTDLVATDRASVRWEDPGAQPLLEWGEGKVRELLALWSKSREEANDRLLRKSTKHWERVDSFPARERRELSSALRRLSAIEAIDDASLDSMADAVIRAYENRHLSDLVADLSVAKVSPSRILELISEVDVQEAAAVAQLMRTRVEALRQLTVLALGGQPQPKWSEMIERHAWLLGVDWQWLTRATGDTRRQLVACAARVPKSYGEFLWLSGFRRLGVVVLRPRALVRDEYASVGSVLDCARTVIKDLRLAEAFIVATTEGPRTPRSVAPGITVLSLASLIQRSEREHAGVLKMMLERAPLDPRISSLPR